MNSLDGIRDNITDLVEEQVKAEMQGISI